MGCPKKSTITNYKGAARARAAYWGTSIPESDSAASNGTEVDDVADVSGPGVSTQYTEIEYREEDNDECDYRGGVCELVEILEEELDALAWTDLEDDSLEDIDVKVLQAWSKSMDEGELEEDKQMIPDMGDTLMKERSEEDWLPP
jgi:hypothetical protein